MKNSKLTLKKIYDFLEVHLPSYIFILLIITIGVGVFSRYVLNHPIPQLFELSIYSFVWVIYLGAALAKRYDKHIRFDILYRKYSEKTRHVVDMVFDIITSVAFILLLIPSVRYTIMNYSIKASALRIPWTYLLMCFPIFIILMLFHMITSIIFSIKYISGKEVRIEEEVLPWQ